jgi:hypothetical protein
MLPCEEEEEEEAELLPLVFGVFGRRFDPKQQYSGSLGRGLNILIKFNRFWVDR